MCPVDEMQAVSEIKEKLESFNVQPSAPRLAIARVVLNTTAHPTVEDVKAEVEKFFPMVSLATVYNTLNLFVEKRLLRSFKDQESGLVRYDPNMSAHFHFLDEESGQMLDIPAESLKFEKQSKVFHEGFEISSIEVVLKGRLRKKKSKDKSLNKKG